MSAVSKWANGLPQPHANLIVGIASSWKTQLDIYTHRNERLSPGFSLAKPNLKKWLSFYRDHRKLTNEALAYFEEAGTDLSLLPNLYGKQDAFSTEVLDVLIDSDSKAIPSELPDLGQFAFPLSMAFNILVWFPCMFLYGNYPPALLRKARHGDLEVLCDLIRIDRSVLFDPVISQRVHTWTMQQQEYKLNRVGSAFAKGIKEIPTRKVKIAWAQYAYDAATTIGMPIEAPQVRALFDAFAQDDGLGMHDPDLIEMTDDAFYQALAKRKKAPSSLLRFRKD